MNPGLLLERAPYTPFMERRTTHPPGLSPMDPAQWFPVDPDFAEQMAYRVDLLEARRDVVLATLPEAAEATAELYRAVLDHLAADPRFHTAADRVTRPDGITVSLDPAEPLDTLGRLIADDLCLLLPGEEYRLVAAVLCFPSRWLLSEKLGHPLSVIHDPVPDYDDALAARVNRVFQSVRPGRPMVRVNWLVHATPELHLPLGLSDKLIGQADPGQGIYLRTERQTLTRLPRSGAVVFGIKTSLCPLEALRPAEALALHDALQHLSAEVITYRAGSDLHGAALARLWHLARGT